MNFLIKTAFKLIFLLVIGVVGYNLFGGTDDEKAKSKEVIDEVKGAGVAIYGLLKSEKKKFDEGKYDEVGDNLESTFKK